MGKKAKKKYYAIKKGKGVTNIIVTNWKVCSELVLGYNAIYKSFLTEEEAKDYLGDANRSIIKEKIVMSLPITNMEKLKISKGKEKPQKFEEIRRSKKASTKELRVRIPTELYLNFENKCIEMELDKDKIIKNMIMEWLC